MIDLKSQRLQLREVCISDSEFILRLINEPAWHEFITSHSMTTISEASDYIDDKLISMYKNHGFGLWLVVTIDNDIPIGICGLIKRDSLDDIDLGFAFLEKYWGMGFAYEASKVCLEYASLKLNAEQIAAITSPSNARSINLLEKVGFRYASEFSHTGSSEILSLYLLSLQ